MTSTPPASPPRIRAYDLTAPTEADALAALQRVFGAARGIDAWTAACRAAGLAAGSIASVDELQRAADTLATQPGAAPTVARAITLRIRTYNWLAARAAATGGR